MRNYNRAARKQTGAKQEEGHQCGVHPQVIKLYIKYKVFTNLVSIKMGQTDCVHPLMLSAWHPQDITCLSTRVMSNHLNTVGISNNYCTLRLQFALRLKE